MTLFMVKSFQSIIILSNKLTARVCVFVRARKIKILRMKTVDQRSRDYSVIKSLCKGADSVKCPLVYKDCNCDNCPLFFLISFSDCDIAADIVFDGSFDDSA